MKKILFIDDDAALQTAVSRMLASEYQVLSALDGREGLSLSQRELPDLILLDLGLPDYDGFELCKTLRENPRNRSVPILVLTGDADPASAVTALGLGADDYVRKPFHSGELRARIDARLRQKVETELGERDRVHLGNLVIDCKTQEVRVADEIVTLTQFELQLLTYLIDHMGEVVLRQKLFGVLWPDSIVNARTIDTHVAHLRKKLVNFDHQIRTVHRAGYKLVPAADAAQAADEAAEAKSTTAR